MSGLAGMALIRTTGSLCFGGVLLSLGFYTGLFICIRGYSGNKSCQQRLLLSKKNNHEPVSKDYSKKSQQSSQPQGKSVKKGGRSYFVRLFLVDPYESRIRLKSNG